MARLECTTNRTWKQPDRHLNGVKKACRSRRHRGKSNQSYAHIFLWLLRRTAQRIIVFACYGSVRLKLPFRDQRFELIKAIKQMLHELKTIEEVRRWQNKYWSINNLISVLFQQFRYFPDRRWSTILKLMVNVTLYKINFEFVPSSSLGLTAFG